MKRVAFLSMMMFFVVMLTTSTANAIPFMESKALKTAKVLVEDSRDYKNAILSIRNNLIEGNFKKDEIATAQRLLSWAYLETNQIGDAAEAFKVAIISESRSSIVLYMDVRDFEDSLLYLSCLSRRDERSLEEIYGPLVHRMALKTINLDPELTGRLFTTSVDMHQAEGNDVFNLFLKRADKSLEGGQTKKADGYADQASNFVLDDMSKKEKLAKVYFNISLASKKERNKKWWRIRDKGIDLVGLKKAKELGDKKLF